MEALKRELIEENRERAVLRDRPTEKGQSLAPAAPTAAAVSKTREVDYVGFANLPNQVYRRAVKKGFEFTLMVVGESGLGKSTLINSMFLADIYSPEYPGPSHRIKKTVQVSFSSSSLPFMAVVDKRAARMSRRHGSGYCAALSSRRQLRPLFPHGTKESTH